MSTSPRRPPSTPRPELTPEIIRSPELRWAAIDRFLASASAIQALRTKLAVALDALRDADTAGFAEDIEEVGNELRAEMLDQVVTWAFEEGRRAGRRERRG